MRLDNEIMAAESGDSYIGRNPAEQDVIITAGQILQRERGNIESERILEELAGLERSWELPAHDLQTEDDQQADIVVEEARRLLQERPDKIHRRGQVAIMGVAAIAVGVAIALRGKDK